MDSTQPSALQEAGIPDFDTVIVAIGNYIQESIITTLNVKEAGVANVTEAGDVLTKISAEIEDISNAIESIASSSMTQSEAQHE